MNVSVAVDNIVVDFGAIGLDDVVTDFMVFLLVCRVVGVSMFYLTSMQWLHLDGKIVIMLNSLPIHK